MTVRDNLLQQKRWKSPINKSMKSKLLSFFSQKVPKSELFVKKEKIENILPPKEHAISEACVVLSIPKKQILQKNHNKNFLSQPKKFYEKFRNWNIFLQNISMPAWNNGEALVNEKYVN